MPTLGMNGTMTQNSLRYLPWEHDLITTSVPGGWGHAMNDLLSRRQRKNDCIITDDDVMVLPHTFAGFEAFYGMADIFGFLLVYPTITLGSEGSQFQVQHDGGKFYEVENNVLMSHIFQDCNALSYVGHITTSFCYVKAHVFDEIKSFYEWPGVQWEDVAFCVQAQQAGFKVMYVPQMAVHAETQTKRHTEDDFWNRFMENNRLFNVECGSYARELIRKFGPSGRIHLGN
jgi:hypothetical protein